MLICKKRNTLLLTLSVVVALLVGINGTASTADYILRLGHNMPETHPYHLGAAKFAEILLEKSEGRIEIDVYPQAQLGEQAQLLEMVSAGTLDLCETWQGSLESYDADIGMVTLPFLFEDWKHVWEVIDGPIGQNIFEGVQKNNIKVLTCFFNGTYNIVGNAYVEKPEDLRGKKIRVQPSPLFSRIFEALRSVVTPLPFAEVYTAMQLGTVDLQIQNPTNMKENQHHEVCKYVTENHMFHLLEPVSMSIKSFNRFSKEDQELIIEAAQEAAIWQREISEEMEADSKDYLIERGVTYILPEDIGVWYDSVKGIYEQEIQRNPHWEDAIKAILKTEMY